MYGLPHLDPFSWILFPVAECSFPPTDSSMLGYQQVRFLCPTRPFCGVQADWWIPTAIVDPSNNVA